VHTVIVEEWLARVGFVLVEPSHVGNIGAVARAMKTMGLRQLVVVAPRDRQFASAPEALAFASGAGDVLAAARVVESLDEALAGTVAQIATASSPREFGATTMDPDAAAALALQETWGLRSAAPAPASAPTQPVPSASPRYSVAFVFGTERVGLSIAQTQRCSHFAMIPTAPGCDSLNLAQAAQVFGWSLRRAALVEVALGRAALAVAAPLKGLQYASHEQVEGLFEHLEQTLLRIGYLDPLQPKRLMPRLRNLFGRTRLDGAEVDLLRGICRAISKGFVP
jgi:tRNA/rRNA methyltransferase